MSSSATKTIIFLHLCQRMPQSKNQHQRKMINSVSWAKECQHHKTSPWQSNVPRLRESWILVIRAMQPPLSKYLTTCVPFLGEMNWKLTWPILRTNKMMHVKHWDVCWTCSLSLNVKSLSGARQPVTSVMKFRNKTLSRQSYRSLSAILSKKQCKNSNLLKCWKVPMLLNVALAVKGTQRQNKR